ncbi:hypothetical protein JVT61DRAFT_12862 [Boletus reticuloceps]|uniref:Uncharacterized protein n=1 Tax=Boletus reticuloceps TaxID=495285 RepID=A0A8I2YU69_9AGAM|nr:hypothetical protein JVT61DRAFT_12862 [Boletus reticuloceps]
MPLITRGRLSVQRVSAKCWDVIQTMAEQGDWDNISFEKKKASKTRHPVDGARPTTRHQRMERLADAAIRDDATKQPEEQVTHQANTRRGRKRKASTSVSPENEALPRRESLRRKR